MTSADLVTEGTQRAPQPSPPHQVINLAIVSLIVDACAIALMVYAAILLRDFNQDNLASTIAGIILVLISLYPLWPTAQGFLKVRSRSTLLSGGRLVESRRVAAAGREDAMVGIGYGAAAFIVAGVLWVIVGNGAGIADSFFRLHSWELSFGQMLRGFWINIWTAVVAQVFVLIFGLILAVMRMLPGRAGAPLRMLSTAYCDIFRAIPGIVNVLLIVFGIPLAFKTTSHWNPAFLGVIALTMTYSAYVAEVYRAGLASIHPSQEAAARSLGLSYIQTLRTVLVPQAVRRMIPPLLNDFISLQKDTALLSVAGIVEVLQTATFWESKLFIIAPVTLAAIFFIIITIPQARFLDFLIKRDAAKRTGG